MPRSLSFKAGFMGISYRPVQYGARRALVLINPLHSKLYALGSDGAVAEKHFVGGVIASAADVISMFMVWTIIPYVFMAAIALTLALVMNRYKLRYWHASDGRAYEFANFFRRFLAHTIDSFILMVPLYAVAFYWADDVLTSAEPLRMMLLFMALMFLGFMVVPFFYYSLFEGLGGKTPGKFLCGIRVVKDDFTRCGIGAAMIRTLLGVADAFFYYLVGAVAIGATLKWQRIGDLAASTVVIKDRK